MDLNDRHEDTKYYTITRMVVGGDSQDAVEVWRGKDHNEGRGFLRGLLALDRHLDWRRPLAYKYEMFCRRHNYHHSATLIVKEVVSALKESGYAIEEDACRRSHWSAVMESCVQAVLKQQGKEVAMWGSVDNLSSVEVG